MAQQLQHTGTDTYFLVILLLLSYVLSSAPRFVRDLNDKPQKSIDSRTRRPVAELMKAGKIYAVDPYIRVWQQLRPKAGKPEIISANY